jgi:tyrosyl-tRNA synthetase
MKNDSFKRAAWLETLKRGTVEIFSEAELAEKLAVASAEGQQLRIKLGLDPTSPDIHLGHVVVLRKMRQFQDLGHRAVLIIGDYTARIGDPSGQNSTRPMLTRQQIEQNARTYFSQASRILATDEEKLEIRYNSEWLEGLSLIELIKLAATKTVAQMLQRDSFKARLNAGEDVYAHEFLYPLMQGYDSVMVKSDVELGGTDQTFNNLVGRDIQRSYGQPPQIVITMPILAGLDGQQKMSKSKDNYVGIAEAADEMFGKLMSITDEMMPGYFTLLTDLPREKIAELTDPGKNHPRQAKDLLARTIVEAFHDTKAATAASKRFERIFSKKKLPEEMPEVTVPAGVVAAGRLLVACGLAATGGEAKRLVRQGGASIDGQRLEDPNHEVVPKDGMVVRAGKRRFVRLKIEAG